MSTPPPDDVQYLDLADYLWLADNFHSTVADDQEVRTRAQRINRDIS
jgi:hypothetical protein